MAITITLKSNSAPLTIDLSAGYVGPPATINAVGSTSGSISDTASLVSPGTPVSISDLAGSGGSSVGTVDLTWSEPVGVQ